MLVTFLLKLSAALKAENVMVVPEQVFAATRYILMTDEHRLSPDDNLIDSLKPIFVLSKKDEDAYERAWKKLYQEKNSSSQKDKLNFYTLIEGRQFDKGSQDQYHQTHSSANLQEYEWAPWKRFRQYREGGSKNLFEHAAMEAFAREEESKKWEKAFTETLQNKFLSYNNPEALEKLLTDAIAFRKELSRLKRRWNQVINVMPEPTRVNVANKSGEKHALRPVYKQGYRANTQRWGDPQLFMRPMEKITEEDVIQLETPIRQMAERLRIRLEWMKQQGRKKIDLQQTLRASRKTYGEPMRIIQKRPKYKLPQWVILSDVSGSVKHATRLFMSFLFELKSVMTENVRGFVFVSQIQEITEMLQEEEYAHMVNRIYRDGEIDFRGYSDYGVAFSEFDMVAENILDRETILLIIGDARNNRRNPRLDLLQKWSRRARKILWFNPELPEKWDQGDSIINIYAKATQHIYDVSTPEKLVDAIENVVI